MHSCAIGGLSCVCFELESAAIGPWRLWQAFCSAGVSIDIDPSASKQSTAPVGLQTECITSQTANEQTAIDRRGPATCGWRSAMGHAGNAYRKLLVRCLNYCKDRR